MTSHGSGHRSPMGGTTRPKGRNVGLGPAVLGGHMVLGQVVLGDCHEVTCPSKYSVLWGASYFEVKC